MIAGFNVVFNDRKGRTVKFNAREALSVIGDCSSETTVNLVGGRAVNVDLPKRQVKERIYKAIHGEA